MFQGRSGRASSICRGPLSNRMHATTATPSRGSASSTPRASSVTGESSPRFCPPPARQLTAVRSLAEERMGRRDRKQLSRRKALLSGAGIWARGRWTSPPMAGSLIACLARRTRADCSESMLEAGQSTACHGARAAHARHRASGQAAAE